MFTSNICFFYQPWSQYGLPINFISPFSSASLGLFSLFHWDHLLHFWHAWFHNKYTCPPQCFFFFLFPPCSNHWWILQMFCHCLSLILGPSSFSLFSTTNLVIFHSLLSFSNQLGISYPNSNTKFFLP